MSDDLVKRLRQSWDADRSIISQTDLWMTERVAAADRIEELEAACWRMKEERDRAIGWRDSDKDRADAAEAKLAKLETAAQKALGHITGYGEASTARIELRTTLAELTGGKDE